MGLQPALPSDLITIDSNYRTRIEERRAIMASHPHTVLGSMAAGVLPVSEVYTYLLADYLPRRYPTMFALDGGRFHNRVTGRSSPIRAPSDTAEALRTLGETVEEDLFLLARAAAGHVAVAFVCCHPAGFDPSRKLGLPLRDIHAPVPAYGRIGLGMERLFGRLEVGSPVKRLNWSVTTRPDLFTPEDSHLHAGEEAREDEAVDIGKARVRVEVQTLTRLPQTGAVLFSFKSYLYPVEDVKAEGLGPQLADAIEGLKHGNAPGMWVYKGGVRWGKEVCEYLRS